MSSDHFKIHLKDNALSASSQLSIAHLDAEDIHMGHTEIRVKGETVSVPSVLIDGRTVISTGRWLKIAAVKDEDVIEGETLPDPPAFISRLKETRLKATILYSQSGNTIRTKKKVKKPTPADPPPKRAIMKDITNDRSSSCASVNHLSFDGNFNSVLRGMKNKKKYL